MYKLFLFRSGVLNEIRLGCVSYKVRWSFLSFVVREPKWFLSRNTFLIKILFIYYIRFSTCEKDNFSFIDVLFMRGPKKIRIAHVNFPNLTISIKLYEIKFFTYFIAHIASILSIKSEYKFSQT